MLLYMARDFRSRQMFRSLHKYCRGSVLDVGGLDFYVTIKRKGIPFDSWTILEVDRALLPDISNEEVRLEVGDGCAMTFPSNSYDTVVCIQVLEHVFEPISMMQEMCRVLRPGGHLIMLLPQTATLHLAPHHYQNFTRFWIQEALRRNGMEQLELKPLGGAWSSIASRLLYLVLQSVRYGKMSTAECKRNPMFYILYPIMILFAAVVIPICLVLSLGDLTEEPNNHLAVARKPKDQHTASLSSVESECAEGRDRNAPREHGGR